MNPKHRNSILHIRPSAHKLEYLELNIMEFDANKSDYTIFTPAWLCNKNRVAKLYQNEKINGYDWWRVGMLYSFMFLLSKMSLVERYNIFDWKGHPWIDFKKALKCFHYAVQNGYREAYNEIGIIHAGGYGTKVDPEEAFRSFQKAAIDTQESIILKNQALCYEQGFGVKQNKKERDNCYTYSTLLRTMKNTRNKYYFSKNCRHIALNEAISDFGNEKTVRTLQR